jgi:GH18 family chitinase
MEELILAFSNQWVSYDDEKTFKIKLNYANERCLGGTMIWSVDQDDSFDYAARKFSLSHFPPSLLSFVNFQR